MDAALLKSVKLRERATEILGRDELPPEKKELVRRLLAKARQALGKFHQVFNSDGTETTATLKESSSSSMSSSDSNNPCDITSATTTDPRVTAEMAALDSAAALLESSDKEAVISKGGGIVKEGKETETETETETDMRSGLTMTPSLSETAPPPGAAALAHAETVSAPSNAAAHTSNGGGGGGGGSSSSSSSSSSNGAGAGAGAGTGAGAGAGGSGGGSSRSSSSGSSSVIDIPIPPLNPAWAAYKIERKPDEAMDANFPPHVHAACELFLQVGAPDRASRCANAAAAYTSILLAGPDGRTQHSMGRACVCWSCGHLGLPRNAARCSRPGSKVPGECAQCGSDKETNFVAFFDETKGYVLPWIEIKGVNSGGQGGRRVKPNEKCPCASGKKYKKCCGAVA